MRLTVDMLEVLRRDLDSPKILALRLVRYVAPSKHAYQYLLNWL
jgi:hypothetical protein